jgi:hypothetical protein
MEISELTLTNGNIYLLQNFSLQKFIIFTLRKNIFKFIDFRYEDGEPEKGYIQFNNFGSCFSISCKELSDRRLYILNERLWNLSSDELNMITLLDLNQYHPFTTREKIIRNSFLIDLT